MRIARYPSDLSDQRMTSGAEEALPISSSLMPIVSGTEEFEGMSPLGSAVKIGADVALTEKATRPETTCPSELTNFQRAVISPVSDVGNKATTMLSVAP